PAERFQLAGAQLEADFQPWVPAQAPGVLGAEVLGLLPLSLDPRTGLLALRPTFPPVEHSGVPLERHARAACDEPGVSFALQAPVEGRTVTWLLDTGAEHTVLRSGRVDALAPDRARLEGVVLETAFAGVIQATATRVSRLELGAGTAHQVVILSGAALDAELDRQSEWISRAANRPVTVDGLLGWNVLREGVVAFHGPPAGPASALTFTPYAPSPWPRAFVGVGLALVPDGTSLRVASVYTPSPAAEAGIASGDLLLTVDGQAAAEAPSPFAPPGQPVTLVLRRGGQTLERTVTAADLLPDAPAQ
ncbi:MAG: PDZ domain-containing protein, partial [Deltaproteobacteria bacterium]|nr:PDZ domain-containing protein [Deltaproteobacteria bacterium]